jgi:hypothetical protein
VVGPVQSLDSYRDHVRQKVVAAIPRWYSPWAHLACPSTIGLALIVACVSLLDRPSWWELLTIPAVWVLSNAIEWRAHKRVLHERTWYAPILYDRHTPLHHRVFVTEDMAIRSTKEFRLVLIPAFGILVLFVGVMPFAAGLWLLGARNPAVLFMATSMAYVLSYEWLHLAYHAPVTSWIGRTRLISRLRRHHATHHSPELMQRWNFNVTVPLWDWLKGTIYRG